MQGFIQKYSRDVTGTLNGWDRLRLRGTLRALSFVGGVMKFFWHAGVRLTEFGDFVQEASRKVKDACEEVALRLNRPVPYLASASVCKEDLARQIAQTDRVDRGLVAVLKCVEPCSSYKVRPDHDTQRLRLEPAFRKCLHYYHYWMDEDFGLMSARVQTWLPFTIHVCVNGRAWLAQQMDRRGMKYVRRDNCFARLEDPIAAQGVMDELLRWNWPAFLSNVAAKANPALAGILKGFPVEYYWPADQSEWASDVMFRRPGDLAAIYPALARGAVTAFDGASVMRFLGKRPESNAKADVVSDYGRRVQGVRVKHAVGQNSVKMYDKQGSVLRVETTINRAKDMRVFRHAEGDSQGPMAWHTMRKGVVDLRRRGEVSQKCNERYYDALTALDTSTPLRDLIRPICRPTKLGNQRVRGLRPWAEDDLALLRAVNRPEFAVQGLRNRDLAAVLHPNAAASEGRRISARISHRLRLLRAHHLIKKVPRSHRYQMTDSGRQIVTALLQAHDLSLEQLLKPAA